MSRKQTVTRWSVVLHEPAGDCDVDGGFLTEQEAQRNLEPIAQAHGWPVEAMTVEPRQQEV